MAGPTPIVRQMVVCERLTFDTATGGYTLTNPRVDFVAPPGHPLPMTVGELWVFVQVTGSFGPQPFRIRLLDVTDPTRPPETIYSTPERVIHLGQPPGQFRRQSRSWAVRLTNVRFPRAGQYEFWAEFGGLPQGRVAVTVEDNP